MEKKKESRLLGIVRTEQFCDIPVRIVDQGSKKMIPVPDISKGIGYSRGNLTKILTNNAEFFSDYQGVVVTTTPSRDLNSRNGGPQEIVCLTRDGVIALLMALDISKIKDPEKKARILQFRKWAVQKLGAGIDKEALLSQPLTERQKQWETVSKIWVTVALAKAMALKGMTPEEALKQTIREASQITGIPEECLLDSLLTFPPEIPKLAPGR